MIQVINGEIKQYSLPKVGTLKNGSTVSGYHLLDEEILLDEGWLPLEDIKPEYDEETEIVVATGYDIQANKVVRLYEVKPMPVQEEYPDIKAMEQTIIEQQQLIDTMLGVSE